MELYGLSARIIAELTGVSLKTATRWKRHGKLPPTAARLLSLTVNANLGAIAKPWDGFHLKHGVLWTPEQESLTPGDLRAIKYRAEQLRALQKELATPRQLILL